MRDRDLRSHYALNKCGLVPSGAVLPFPDEVLEDSWRHEVEAIGVEMGLKVAHCERLQGKRGQWLTPMAVGWPDTIFLAERGGMLAVEFKAGRNKATRQQVAWLLALDRTCGVTARCFWPADWPVLYHLLTTLR